MLKLDFADPSSYSIINWAEEIKEEDLTELGRSIVEDVSYDDKSRQGWLDEADLWVEMASQVIEEKSEPWEGAANIKFPLLTTAALQFHARAHEELLKGDQVVRGRVIGDDPKAEKRARSLRVSRAMSNQLLYEMEDWQEDTDRLLFVLPLVGTVFRKTYWSRLLDRPASELILPSDLIVNYYATDWERCRKTHLINKSRNELIEKMREGEYLEYELPPAAVVPEEDSELPQGFEKIYPDKDVPFQVYEVYGWWDLDDDGYEEPYIINVLKQTEQVLSIYPRFDPSRIRRMQKGNKISRIEPYEFITVHKFLPDVESSIYGIGLGKLLGPTNAAIDSIINQLLDAGHLATLPAGVYGRGVRIMRGGELSFRPGEWKMSNARGEDLQKSFWPLPAKEPSPVLMQLLGLLIQSGEKMGSVTESMAGKMPGQNTPAGTASDVMEQGMKVFIGIYKRLYRSLTKEFRVLQRLNYLYLTPDSYQRLMDFQQEVPPPPGPPGPNGQPGPPQGPPQYQPMYLDPMADFDPAGLDVIPEADPDLSNSMRKRKRAQQLVDARRAGMPLNDKYIVRLFLESIDEPDVDKVMQNEPPPPSESQLNHQAKMAEIEIMKQEAFITASARENDSTLALAKAMQAIAQAMQGGENTAVLEMENALKMMQAEHAQRANDAKMMRDQLMGRAKLDQDRESHQQKLAFEGQKGKQKLAFDYAKHMRDMEMADKKLEVEDVKKDSIRRRAKKTSRPSS